MNVVGDYCMFCKKQSDVIYKASDNVMGYALKARDWAHIEKTCLTELTEGVKQQALEKYINLWMFLKRKYIPLKKSMTKLNIQFHPSSDIYAIDQNDPMIQRYMTVYKQMIKDHYLIKIN